MNMRLIPVSFLVLLSGPAYGEKIGKLAAGAYCRDETGAIRQPRVKPPEHAEAQRAPNNMIKIDEPGFNDCYLYSPEAALSETPGPCPTAPVGGSPNKIAGTVATVDKPSSDISGTLGPKSCNDN